MSTDVYKWIVVYEDGRTEIVTGECPYSFADDLVDVPIAIIRAGFEWLYKRVWEEKT